MAVVATRGVGVGLVCVWILGVCYRDGAWRL